MKNNIEKNDFVVNGKLSVHVRVFFIPYWLKLIPSIQISFTGHQRNLKNVHSFDWNAACWEAISGNVKVCISPL